MVFRPGELDQRIELQKPSYSSDGQGGQDKTFAVQDTVWAHVRPLTGNERSHADLLQAEGGYLVVVRMRNDIDETWRINWLDRARLMNIRFLEDTGKRKLYLQIQCERGVPT